MDTSEFIEALAADRRPPAASLSSVWWGAAGLAVAIAAVVFNARLDLRPDIAAAVGTFRFQFKFAITISLAVSAFGLASALSRPGESWRRAMPYLGVPPALLALSVAIELVLLPPDTWAATMIGMNSMVCLAYITLIGIGPLAILLAALRHGAPTKPAAAGAVAGLLAGGIAASFYAAQCPEDSPLFIATWYTIAVAGLALAGAAGANRLVRW